MFQSPYVLLLLLLLPLALWRKVVSGKRSAVGFSSVAFAASLTPTLRQRLAWLPTALWTGGIALLIVALAGPREGRQQTIVDSEGIAIQMVIDRSGSMQALDFKKQNEPVNRLTAVKDVASRFLLGDGQLDGRIADLVGLITFSGVSDSICPPTLDHGFVVDQLNHTQIDMSQVTGGTAIGDGLGLAVEKLAALDESHKEEIKSKIVILLTDGENTMGDLDPMQAAELAKMMDVKVYTIGVGSRGRAQVPVTDPFGRQRLTWMDVNIDEETLTEIADLTGGKYFRATDTESLEQIYTEIDQLEKSKVETRHVEDYRELAVQPIQWAGWSFPSVALLALVLLSLQLVLKSTVFKVMA